MDKYMFPAVFQPCKEGGYSIYFPDLPGCISEGDTLEEALAMAKDGLELFLWNMEDGKEEIPEPTPPEGIKIEDGNFVVPIIADMKLARAQMNNKTVNTNVTIPQWLKFKAEENKINFSQLLQEAIKQKLNING